MKSAPHFLLLTDTDQFDEQTSPATAGQHSIAQTNIAGGRWHFVLEPIHNGVRIEADDIEPGVFGERLNLLAVVRGIEALEQPSNVTLITPSRYVGRGIRRDIRVWKENNWQWDRFGRRVSVKHADLWQRIERAMQFHQIDCRIFGSGQRSRTNETTEQLKDLSLAHVQSSPYETPFANSNLFANANPLTTPSTNHSVLANRQRPTVPQSNQQRRIVLTSERMSDELLELDNTAALEARHQRLFKATKTGWTRVTEIDADSPIEGKLPAAFGCSAN